MSELVKLDETSLKARLDAIDAKIATVVQMPDDIKQKLKDVLTWVISTL